MDFHRNSVDLPTLSMLLEPFRPERDGHHHTGGEREDHHYLRKGEREVEGALILLATCNTNDPLISRIMNDLCIHHDQTKTYTLLCHCHCHHQYFSTYDIFLYLLIEYRSTFIQIHLKDIAYIIIFGPKRQYILPRR